MRWYMKVVRTFLMVAGVCIISSVITMGTTAIVVDGYIQSALKQFNVPLQYEPVTASSIWKALWGGADNSKQAANNSQSSSNSASESEAGVSSESKDAEDQALPVWGSVTGEAGAGNQWDEVVVPPESWTDSKSQLPMEMKDEIFRTLLQKLPQEEWQRISTLMEGGLTSTELSEVEQLLAKHLNDEEYTKMREMLAGTGLDTENNKEASTEPDTELNGNNMTKPSGETSPEPNKVSDQEPSASSSSEPGSSQTNEEEVHTDAIRL